MANMKYLLNCRSFISLMILFSFFGNFGMEGETKEDYDHLFKIGFVGDAGVGKTQIINKFVGNKFLEDYVSTIGVDFYGETVNCENKKIRLQLWDTSGQKKYEVVRKNFYRNFHLFVLVCAVDDKNSFDNIQIWVNEVRSINENAKFLLVGNKCDLKKEESVSTKEAIEYAGINNMAFFEVSAKDEINIENMFNFIIQELLKDMEKEKNNNLTYNNPTYNNPTYIDYKNFDSIQDIDDIKNKKTSFCDKYCSCCPCLKKTEKNNENQDNEEQEEKEDEEKEEIEINENVF